MKMLLYEPGSEGHRPVILRYTMKVLTHAGVDWVHEGRDLRNTPAALIKKAKDGDCDVIYIMTVETLARFAWQVSWMAKWHGIRLICSYYLFNNLREGWKASGWRVLLFTSHIETIFISDDALRDGVRKYPKQVRYLPDPWDPEEFPIWTQEIARKKLDLPIDSVVFLMFGALDERKGADHLLKAAAAYADAAEFSLSSVFLLAGTPTKSIRLLYERYAANAEIKGFWALADGYIPEKLVSTYFCACDYVICAYPPSFKVSSGSITRALAAGRPFIVPRHGVNAELAKTINAGYIFDRDGKSKLSCVLNAAARTRLKFPAVWQAQAQRSKQAGAIRDLRHYGAALVEALIF